MSNSLYELIVYPCSSSNKDKNYELIDSYKTLMLFKVNENKDNLGKHFATGKKVHGSR